MTGHEAPIVNIAGRLVALGPLRREHLPLFLRWVNDFGTTRTLGLPTGPMTMEQETTWFESAALQPHSFAIYERESGRAIGNCSLHGVDWPNRTTTVGIMIGEPNARGRGYGTEAMRLLLDYVFTVLGLHSAMLNVFAFNPAARRSYEKVGFREIGRRRESRWFNGRFWDEIQMDILSSEFESPVLKAKLEPGSPRD